MDYYLYKGKIIRDEDFNPGELWINNRVRLEADMWFAHGQIPFFDWHMERFNCLLAMLGRYYRIEIPEQRELLRLSHRLVNKNKAYMGGWLRLWVFPEAEGWQFWATVLKNPRRQIPFHETGRLAIVSDEIKHSSSEPCINTLQTPLAWAVEKLRISGTRFEEVIICNEYGKVTEAAGSNIFCITGSRLVTPSPDTGCHADPLRDYILAAAKTTGLEVTESSDMVPDDLQTMDEIFTGSEKEGFAWIMGIGIKRFVKKYSPGIRDTAELLLWKDRLTGVAGG